MAIGLSGYCQNHNGTEDLSRCRSPHWNTLSAVSATPAATSTFRRVSPPRISLLRCPVGPCPTTVGLGGCSIPAALLQGAQHQGKPKDPNRREPGAGEHQYSLAPSHSCRDLRPTGAAPDTRHSQAPERFA